MAYLISKTGEIVNKLLDTGYYQPHHDCADSVFVTGDRQSINASTEYAFECDCEVLDNKNLPAHITKLWDNTTNKAVFTEELDTPVYAARIQLNFDPTVAAAGFMEFRAYIDDAAGAKLIQTIRVPYKATDSRMEVVFNFYVGSQAGYDMKQYGLYFTYEADGAGEIYDRGILLYR